MLHSSQPVLTLEATRSIFRWILPCVNAAFLTSSMVIASSSVTRELRVELYVEKSKKLTVFVLAECQIALHPFAILDIDQFRDASNMKFALRPFGLLVVHLPACRTILCAPRGRKPFSRIPFEVRVYIDSDDEAIARCGFDETFMKADLAAVLFLISHLLVTLPLYHHFESVDEHWTFVTATKVLNISGR